MKSTDKKFLEKIINKYSNDKNKINNYPLTSTPFETSDIIKGAETLIGGRITMSKITSEFESQFAKFLGVKYALMVNSGSSANLLALFGLVNPKNKKKIKKNDECILPAICWSTSLWPIVQSGLKPVFIDVDLSTFNLNLEDLQKKINSRTKAVLAVHILGNCTNMNKLLKIVNKKKITLIEDTCESLGSVYNNKYLGTFGKYGTYSFYVSHQMTAGEGGMVVCNNIEDYKIIHALRAHGWDRGLFKKNNRNFNFVNSGFNLRPLDLTAAIGLSQFKRLNRMNKIRSDNRNRIINSLKKSLLWSEQFTFLDPIKKLKPSWFGLPILINKNYLKNKKKFLSYLNKNGIETRPIISGNFLNQPSIKLYGLNENKKKFKNAQEIEDRGFFIGLHPHKINENTLKYLVSKLLQVGNII
mgnify:FL=1|tara:strand:+ start:870 stop:2111 length:1242 start_codon:yes stop_codon:yes gene_type:complete